LAPIRCGAVASKVLRRVRTAGRLSATQTLDKLSGVVDI
jgi:hypothetical protein